MSKYLDTRDLNERLEELAALETAAKDAREALDNINADASEEEREAAESALDAARLEFGDDEEKELAALRDLENEIGREWPPRRPARPGHTSQPLTVFPAHPPPNCSPRSARRSSAPSSRRSSANRNPPHPMTTKDLSSALASIPAGRSAWCRGVHTYATELVESLDSSTDLPDWPLIHLELLNGADSWQQYSEGGCALVYDSDIAERLCNPSELKRCRGRERQPSSRETWLECQARALGQAAALVRRAYRKAAATEGGAK